MTETEPETYHRLSDEDQAHTSWILRRYPMATIRRIVTVLGVILGNVLFVLIGLAAVNLVRTVDRLSIQAARRSPTTEYTVLYNATEACRSSIRDGFFAHVAIGSAHAGDLSPDQREVVQQAIAFDESLLRQIDTVCPYPTPPKYAPNGDLIEGPHGGVPVDDKGRAILPAIPNIAQSIDDLDQTPTTPTTSPAPVPSRPPAAIRGQQGSTSTTGPQGQPTPTTGTTYPSNPDADPPPMLIPSVPVPSIPCNLFVGLAPPNCSR